MRQFVAKAGALCFAIFMTFAPACQTAFAQDEEDANNAETPIEDKWALIVGLSKFQDSNLNLKYPAKDASDFYNYLVTEAHFQPDHVKLITDQDATKERILTELGDRWLPHVTHPNDLVIIFISSHGSPSSMDALGTNYVVVYNTDVNRLYATGLPMQELTSAVRERVHARRVVLILDACHSGAARASKGITRVGNFDSEAILQGTGQLVICSSKSDQVSWESERYPSGVFTAQLLNGLRSHGDKTKLSEAFSVLKENVESEVLADRGEAQTPILKMKWQGNELVLAAPATKPRTAPAPADKATAVVASASPSKSISSADPPQTVTRPDLEFRRLLTSTQSQLAEMEKTLDEIVQSHVVWDVDWTSFGTTCQAIEYVTYQGFDRVLVAARSIAADSVGKQALKGSIKKVIVKNVTAFKQKRVSFSKGILEIDGAWGPDLEGYPTVDQIQRVIENGL